MSLVNCLISSIVVSYEFRSKALGFFNLDLERCQPSLCPFQGFNPVAFLLYREINKPDLDHYYTREMMLLRPQGRVKKSFIIILM